MRMALKSIAWISLMVDFLFLLGCNEPSDPLQKRIIVVSGDTVSYDLDTTLYSTKNVASGLVPNARTAAMIADAVMIGLYGDKVREARPYEVVLQPDSTWHVTGSIHGRRMGSMPHVFISARDGRVIDQYYD